MLSANKPSCNRPDRPRPGGTASKPRRPANGTGNASAQFRVLGGDTPFSRRKLKAAAIAASLSLRANLPFSASLLHTATTVWPPWAGLSAGALGVMTSPPTALHTASVHAVTSTFSADLFDSGFGT